MPDSEDSVLSEDNTENVLFVPQLKEHLCLSVAKFSSGFIRAGFQQVLWWDRAVPVGMADTALAGTPCQPEPSRTRGEIPSAAWGHLTVPSPVLPFHTGHKTAAAPPAWTSFSTWQYFLASLIACRCSLPAFVSWACFEFFHRYCFESSCNCIRLSKTCHLLLVFRAAAV